MPSRLIVYFPLGDPAPMWRVRGGAVLDGRAALAALLADSRRGLDG